MREKEARRRAGGAPRAFLFAAGHYLFFAEHPTRGQVFSRPIVLAARLRTGPEEARQFHEETLR